jgi:succinate dehydrogenase/fumarate reductase flavoprotein subunit
MGQAAGAAVAGMSEAWWVPTVAVPGETYDGHPMARLFYSPMPVPGSIVVNRHGRRFMDEALNYHDQARAYHAVDSVAGEYANLPAWLIFDGRFKRTYPVSGVGPNDPAPAWFHPAPTLQALAERVGIDPAGLQDSLATFNTAAVRGEDPQFGRGFSIHDRFHGDPRHGNLAPLFEPPFHAVEVRPGCFGTKGGLDTDLDGRFHDPDGAPVPGLFAAGNAAASPMGPGYPGAGGTLGPVVVGGYLAGRTAAHESRPDLVSVTDKEFP